MIQQALQEVLQNGFAIVEQIFTEDEIEEILQAIENEKYNSKNFKKSTDLFAVRCFLNEFPHLQKFVFRPLFTALVQSFGNHYKAVKSIYFDKPPSANWVVNWHQDLTISVTQKADKQGFKHWLPKENYYSVQPPLPYLKDMLTFRIHLDDCTQANGALRVIPQSHHQIIHEKELTSNFFVKEETCEAKKGDVLIMKPLIWHSSKRTENNEKRRVIHIEFSSLDLPTPLTWAEIWEKGVSQK